MAVQSNKTIRRQLYERDKILYAIQPFGPQLYSCLIEMLSIAEKYERRDVMIDAHRIINEVKQAVEEVL